MAKDVETAESGAIEETKRKGEEKDRLEEVDLIMDKRIDLAIAVAVLLFGVFSLIAATGISQGSLRDPIGSRGMPIATAVLLTVCGIVVTIMRLRVWSGLPGNLVPGEGKKDEEGHPSSWIRAWSVVVAAWLSMWLLKDLGFLFAMPLFLLVFVLIMGVRSWGKIIGFPIIYTLVLWYVFSQPLKVILPMGPLAPLARSLGLTP